MILPTKERCPQPRPLATKADARSITTSNTYDRLNPKTDSTAVNGLSASNCFSSGFPEFPQPAKKSLDRRRIFQLIWLHESLETPQHEARSMNNATQRKQQSRPDPDCLFYSALTELLNMSRRRPGNSFIDCEPRHIRWPKAGIY